MLVTCTGCDTRYDVSRRAPGKRLRCSRCKGEVVVPGDPDAPEVEGTASARIRKARGPVCLAHPRRAADERCDACGSWTCALCWAPAPADHVCVRCAEERGLGAALPIDFGPVATPLLAVRALVWSLPRVLTWNVLSIASTVMVFAIPLIIAWFVQAPVYAGKASATWGTDLAVIVIGASALGMWVTHFLLLMPAGSAVFVDQAIRGRDVGFLAGLRDAWERFLANAQALVGVLFAAGLVFLPWIMLTLCAAYGVHEALLPAPSANAVATLVLVILGTVGLVPIVVGFGLAVPVVILESRGAAAALGRAWELVRLQPLVFTGLVIGYFLFNAVVGFVTAELVVLIGLPWVFGLVSHIVDLLWPALLVAAYHGLVAEQVGVPGRK